MKHAVLGTGTVGHAIANKLLSLGHDVVMGSRTADNDKAVAFAASHERASAGTFGDAAAAGDLVWNCVSGQHSLAALESAGAGLDGKTLLDLSNPLDFSQGFPPRLFVCNDDSLGEQIQRAHPQAKVVKTFNTLANHLMVDPGQLPAETDVFVAGDDAEAKAEAIAVLKEFGHGAPLDVGALSVARGLEAWLLLWTRLYGAFGDANFNLKIVRGG